ncbi:MAG: NnrU family protein [Aestuariivirgaceae bacterium]|nr:NnrU family protein [Aestuariivirgaceae bacterium]
MILLALAVLAFIAVHLVAAIPPAKAALKARFGKAYGPAFGITSLVTLVLVILAWRAREIVAVYEPPVWGRHATFTLVLIAFLALGVWIFRGSWRQKLRFPLAIATIFWGFGHLFVRGDAASLILFGGIAAYGAAHLALGLAHGIRPSPEQRNGHNLLSILFGIAFYGVFTQLHAVLIGVAVLTLTN